MDSRKVGAGAGENLQKRDEVIEMEIKKQEQTARKRTWNLEKDVHSERTRRKQSRQVERQELSARKKPQFAKEVTWRTSVKIPSKQTSHCRSRIKPLERVVSGENLGKGSNLSRSDSKANRAKETREAHKQGI